MLFDEQFARNLDMIESAMVALAAYVAIRVALGWRRDFVGRRGIEVAETVLTKAYECKEAVRSIRSDLEHFDRYIILLEGETPSYFVAPVIKRLVAKRKQLRVHFEELMQFEVEIRLWFVAPAFSALQRLNGAHVIYTAILIDTDMSLRRLDRAISSSNILSTDARALLQEFHASIVDTQEQITKKIDPLTALELAIESFETDIAKYAQIVPERFSLQHWARVKYAAALLQARETFKRLQGRGARRP